MILAFKEKDGTVNMAVTGTVSKEPRTVADKFLSFSVNFGAKKYMNVKVWADRRCANMAMCLEKGDAVCVTGVYETYVGKDGRQYEQVSADFIAVQNEPPSE